MLMEDELRSRACPKSVLLLGNDLEVTFHCWIIMFEIYNMKRKDIKLEKATVMNGGGWEVYISKRDSA